MKSFVVAASFASLAFGLAACQSSGVQAAPASAPVARDAPAPPTMSARERDRAEVYSALFDAEFAGSTPERSVIASETDASAWLRLYLIAHAPSYLNWKAQVGEAFTQKHVSLGARDSSL